MNEAEYDVLSAKAQAAQMAIRALILMMPDPARVTDHVAKELNRAHAFFSAERLSDTWLSTFEASKTSILPSDDDLQRFG